jgi:ATP-dependent RNA helicase RhlE
MRFNDLGLNEPLLRAIGEEGYETPTPVQQKSIPPALAGKDVMACAQTGTGKTAAFSLPILQRLGEPVMGKGDRRRLRALVITPTRELCAQVGESFKAYGRHTPLRHTTIYGGVRQKPQARAMKEGVDILVATPGRLLDLMGQRIVHLDSVEYFVLDEADRMLDMGFIDDIRKIIRALPRERQNMLFSATIPSSIRRLSSTILHDPVEVRIKPEAPAAETVDQTVYYVEGQDKQALLEHLLSNQQVQRALVFTKTKQQADRVTQYLRNADIPAEAIHSDKPQRIRERTLKKFKNGQTDVLVASDIAARGLDVDDISHVINYDMPVEAETYVHRIGRTGRAGESGKAYSFCSMEERLILDEIEKLLNRPIEHVSEHPFKSPVPIPGVGETVSVAERVKAQRSGRRHKTRRRLI